MKPAEMEIYEDSILIVVADSYGMSSQILTTEEKLVKAKEWSRLLFGVVPENKLQECFDHARKTHNSPFAISAYEIEQSFREIQTKEREEIINYLPTLAEKRAEAEKYKPKYTYRPEEVW